VALLLLLVVGVLQLWRRRGVHVVHVVLLLWLLLLLLGLLRRGPTRWQARDGIADAPDGVEQPVVGIAPARGAGLVARVDRDLLGLVHHGRDGWKEVGGGG
jgi:hypothetical protein